MSEILHERGGDVKWCSEFEIKRGLDIIELHR